MELKNISNSTFIINNKKISPKSKFIIEDQNLANKMLNSYKYKIIKIDKEEEAKPIIIKENKEYKKNKKENR